MTVRSKIIQVHKSNPNLTANELAAVVGCDVKAVYAARKVAKLAIPSKHLQRARLVRRKATYAGYEPGSLAWNHAGGVGK